MKRSELVETGAIPGGGEMQLMRRGEEYAIRVVGRSGDLMSTRMHGSEDKLAEFTCPKIAGRPQPRVLVGGLGIGFTLAAALRHLGGNAEVVVAELVPAVVKWNREYLGAYAGHPLQDGRVTVREADVAQVLQTEPRGFDAILLDVDNGPEGLTRRANDWLYSPPGLEAAKTALRPGGLLAFWSAGPDDRFFARLQRTGMRTEELRVRAHGNKGARHIIWLAEKNR
ncbi:MAG: spermidine synthase [Pseudomonadota bacterium]